MSTAKLIMCLIFSRPTLLNMLHDLWDDGLIYSRAEMLYYCRFISRFKMAPLYTLIKSPSSQSSVKPLILHTGVARGGGWGSIPANIGRETGVHPELVASQ